MGEMLKARFASLDKDRNGGLDASELASAGGRREFRQAARDTPDL
jgi:hypothetical protein